MIALTALLFSEVSFPQLSFLSSSNVSFLGDSVITPTCFLRFEHLNEGLGGTINQLLVGKVWAKLRGKKFCMSSLHDLRDPNEANGHSTDNAWLREYWHLPRCPEKSIACDFNRSFEVQDWKQPQYVWRLYQLLYPDELAELRQRLTASPFNKNFAYCAHVRTGDDSSLPSVAWSGIELHLFGTDTAEYSFCENNTCVVLEKTRDVEFDFVNMMNCHHLAACQSSLSITAKLLSLHNTEYVQMARLDNQHFTEFFDNLESLSQM